MEANGVNQKQIVEVRGYADRKLRKPLQPDDASNRRITVIVRYMEEPEMVHGVIKDGVLTPNKTPDPVPASAPAEAQGQKPSAAR
jgi:hypothetical protein